MTRLFVEEKEVLPRVVDQAVCVVEAHFKASCLLTNLDVHVELASGLILHEKSDFLFLVDQFFLGVQHE